MSGYKLVQAEVEFHLADDGGDEGTMLAALRIKARQLDEENGNDAPESYTFAQALQVCWHFDPEWLRANYVSGWVMNKADTGEGMRPIWS